MRKTLTHGSLFAGIGGFELAAKEAGIVTKWNCEIEPYPRLVLKARFPEVTQYGDIRKLNGGEVAPVDIFTSGSPCQSFSVAGGRDGLNGASGLFYESVRVVKEMRQATNGAYPRFFVMENVPGIYSSKSNGKSDFREVLNELLKIADETVVVPEPRDGKFLTAGAVLGDGYSLAYRTICASKFGVAQRRRRMFLVVDFAGERAAEILSEQEGQGRNFTPSYFARQGSAGSLAESAGSVEKPVAFEPGALARIGKSAWEDETRTLRADMGDNQAAVAYPIDMRNATRQTDGGQGTGIGEDGQPSFTLTAEYTHSVCAIENHPQDGRIKLCGDGNFPTITQRFGTGGGNMHYILDERKQAAPVTQGYVGAVTATDYKGAACLFEPQESVSTYNICSDASNAMRSGNPDSGIYEVETSRTLDCGGGSPTRNQGGTIIAIQGNLIGRDNANGPAGIGFREDVGYTINTVDKGGAVCYQETVSTLTTELAHQTGTQGQVGGQLVVEREPQCYQETVGALCASDYRGIRNQDIGDDKAVVETMEQTVCFGNNGYGKWNDDPATLKANGGDYPGGENLAVENRQPESGKYAVRRLTPLECLRLQGFPDNHLSDIDIQDPTAGQIAYWRDAWAELGKIKSNNVIRKWLANPYSDSNAYKAIGNSLCVCCALFVMRGIVENDCV